METVITDLDQLTEASEQVLLADDKGVNLTEAKDIIAKITEIMDTDKTIIALSAPQIGIKKRVLCIRFQDTVKAFVNPVITKKGDYKISHETCASMPGKEIVVTRPEDITIIYYNNDIKYEENKLLGLAARLFDQQYQFLDGVTPNDLGLVSDILEDGSINDATEEELAEIYKIYKQFIAVKTKTADETIAQDTDLAKAYKNMKFTESVVNNRIQVIEQQPKMNREQRRAAEKQAKKIKTKKAGKR